MQEVLVPLKRVVYVRPRLDLLTTLRSMQVPHLRNDCKNVFAIDNAGIHHARETEIRVELEAVVPHAELEFLPPYSRT